MKYCILGGGGVFGLNCAHYLNSQGHDVFGIGRSPLRSNCWTGGNPYYRYDVRHLTYEVDYVFQTLNLERPDVIVNFAAQGEGAASFAPADWWRFFETNCTGLSRLVGMLAERPWLVRKFIHIGSSEIYGSVHNAVSEDAPIQLSSPYSASKAGFDLFLLSICRALNFPGIIVRPSNCYCPGQQLHRIIPRAFLLALTGKKLPLHGGGIAEKSYLHATDLSKAIAILSEKGDTGNIYNVGPDIYVSIRELVSMIGLRCGREWGDFIEEAPERTGQDSRYWLTSRKMKALGWEPEISLDAGLDTVRLWVIDNLAELEAAPQDFRMRA